MASRRTIETPITCHNACSRSRVLEIPRDSDSSTFLISCTFLTSLTFNATPPPRGTVFPEAVLGALAREKRWRQAMQLLEADGSEERGAT